MLGKLILLLFIVLTINTNAQRVVDVNKDNVNAAALVLAVGGEPFSSVKYVKVVEGTPYFREEWMRGSVTLKDSNEYLNLRLRLDLVANTVEYISKTGQQLVASSALREIRLVDSITGKSFRFIHSSTIPAKEVTTGWYEVLVEGKATLLKRIHKEIQETKPYSSATTEQRINSVNQYFLLSNKSLSRVKKIKDLPGLLPDKKELLLKKIDEQKLTGKNEQDYMELIRYYN